MVDRYGRDVLSADPHRKTAPVVPEVPAESGLVVECAYSGFCGAVIRTDRSIEGHTVELEDGRGQRRMFVMRPKGFLIDGKPVTLVRPASNSAAKAPVRSASGSTYVAGARAQIAKASRIWVEGLHDAELIERIWGHDLRIEGVVVEPLHGADHLLDALAAFGPGPGRRVGVLLDHMVAGSKEQRIAAEAQARHAEVLVVGHPFVDVWQAVRPAALGIDAWPVVPRPTPWKQGVIEALGLPTDEREAWDLILSKVSDYVDLEPAMLGRVEELIDFVTEPS